MPTPLSPPDTLRMHTTKVKICYRSSLRAVEIQSFQDGCHPRCILDLSLLGKYWKSGMVLYSGMCAVDYSLLAVVYLYLYIAAVIKQQFLYSAYCAPGSALIRCTQ